jgi:hypothetical protein
MRVNPESILISRRNFHLHLKTVYLKLLTDYKLFRMFELIKEPWPWYVAGPLIGLFVPLLLIFGNKNFGISSSLRHICAMCVPLNIKYFKYDWKSEKWSLFYVAGIAFGGFIASHFLMMDSKVDISAQTVADLTALGVTDFSSYLPGIYFQLERIAEHERIVVYGTGRLFCWIWNQICQWLYIRAFYQWIVQSAI